MAGVQHEKEGTIHPVLSQLYIPYGMKRPAGEKRKLTNTCEEYRHQYGILCFALSTIPSFEVPFIRKLKLET